MARGYKEELGECWIVDPNTAQNQGYRTTLDRIDITKQQLSEMSAYKKFPLPSLKQTEEIVFDT